MKRFLSNFFKTQPTTFEEFWNSRTSTWPRAPTLFCSDILLKTDIQKVIKVDPDILVEEKSDKNVRFVFTSDTHNMTARSTFVMPDGDVLLHGGDFTGVGSYSQVEEFCEWLDSLQYPIKIVIAGNHERCFDPSTASDLNLEDRQKSIKRLQQSCVYLEDTSCTVHGIKIYGTPWQPEFGAWAYNLSRMKECAAKWTEIPTDTDILISHGPPIGHGDTCRNNIRAGCVDLLEVIQTRVKPKYHLFGHIHEDYGVTTDTVTTYINGSMCNLQYAPLNYPISFDMPKVSDDMDLVQRASPEWTLRDPRSL